MQTKLTLRLDDALIKRAKVWARQRGVSLSEAVASVFAQLPRGEAAPKMTSWTRLLAGAAADDAAGAPPGTALPEDRLSPAQRKHR